MTTPRSVSPVGLNNNNLQQQQPPLAAADSNDAHIGRPPLQHYEDDNDLDGISVVSAFSGKDDFPK